MEPYICGRCSKQLELVKFGIDAFEIGNLDSRLRLWLVEEWQCSQCRMSIFITESGPTFFDANLSAEDEVNLTQDAEVVFRKR